MQLVSILYSLKLKGLILVENFINIMNLIPLLIGLLDTNHRRRYNHNNIYNHIDRIENNKSREI